MNTILVQSRQLIREKSQELTDTSLSKSERWQFINDYKVSSFQATFEHLYSIYKLRWEGTQERGHFIEGLEELVKRMEQYADLEQVQVTSFRSTVDELVLFSDPTYHIFLGLLIFSASSFTQ